MTIEDAVYVPEEAAVDDLTSDPEETGGVLCPFTDLTIKRTAAIATKTMLGRFIWTPLEVEGGR